MTTTTTTAESIAFRAADLDTLIRTAGALIASARRLEGAIGDLDALLRAPELLYECPRAEVQGDLDTVIRSAETLLATAEQLERQIDRTPRAAAERQEASHG